MLFPYIEQAALHINFPLVVNTVCCNTSYCLKILSGSSDPTLTYYFVSRRWAVRDIEKTSKWRVGYSLLSATEVGPNQVTFQARLRLIVSVPSNVCWPLKHSLSKKLLLHRARSKRPWQHRYLSMIVDHFLWMSPKAEFW